MIACKVPEETSIRRFVQSESCNKTLVLMKYCAKFNYFKERGYVKLIFSTFESIRKEG